MIFKVFMTIGAVLLFIKPAASEEASGQICHLANAGFYINGGDKGVLIDANITKAYDYIDAPARSLRQQMETGTGPFSDVVLGISTHYHGDHFSASSTARLLEKNPDIKYILTPQAFDLFEENINPNQTIQVHPALGAPENMVVNGIQVTVFRVNHGPGRGIENLGIYFEVGGVSFFHPGDIHVLPAELMAAGIKDLEIDYLLLPAWAITHAPSLNGVQEIFHYKYVIPMHIVESHREEGKLPEIFGTLENTIRLDGEMDCINIGLEK